MANRWGAPKKRFESKIKVIPETGCWEWQGGRDKTNYGQFSYKNNRAAHRSAYELYVDDIPEGLIVCHKCDNPPCVNPDHLFLGTFKDNTQDCIKKGRFVFQPKDIHPSPAYYRRGCRCEDCVRVNSEYHRKYYAKHKDVYNQKNKEYRLKNIEIIRAKDRERNKLRGKK